MFGQGVHWERSTVSAVNGYYFLFPTCSFPLFFHPNPVGYIPTKCFAVYAPQDPSIDFYELHKLKNLAMTDTEIQVIYVR